MTLLENIMVSNRADKMYPYLKEKDVKKLDNRTKNKIVQNVFSVTLHNIGGTVVGSTDNLIISKYVGLIAVGMYSNYYLIIHAIEVIIVQIFTSITASIGNLAATESKEKLYDVYNKLFFLDAWIYSFATICLLILINDFISLWLGDKFLFNFATVVIIVINFYITGMRQTVLAYKDALGLYWQDKFKPIIEAIVNIVVSIILVKKLGVVGVFLGTIISMLTICFWWEAYVLYKYRIKAKVYRFF